ncbi:hypothetical protein T484DRAFT_1756927 [Baffinella frigidus]|nr:hypothetical protein T484DRAFT_1756927 [Cryptophyta sp. CCMP2293]
MPSNSEESMHARISNVIMDAITGQTGAISMGPGFGTTGSRARRKKNLNQQNSNQQNSNHQNSNQQNSNHQNSNQQNSNHQNSNHQTPNHQNPNHQTPNHQNPNYPPPNAPDRENTAKQMAFLMQERKSMQEELQETNRTLHEIGQREELVEKKCNDSNGPGQGQSKTKRKQQYTAGDTRPRKDRPWREHNPSHWVVTHLSDTDKAVQDACHAIGDTPQKSHSNRKHACKPDIIPQEESRAWGLAERAEEKRRELPERAEEKRRELPERVEEKRRELAERADEKLLVYASEMKRLMKAHDEDIARKNQAGRMAMSRRR